MSFSEITSSILSLLGGDYKRVFTTIMLLFVFYSALAILLAIGIARIIAKWTTHFSLYSTLQGQQAHVRAIRDALPSKTDGGEDTSNYRQLLDNEYDDISKKLQLHREDTIGRKRRLNFHTIVLTLSFVTAWFASNSIVQMICLAGMFTILWYATAVDIDYALLPERVIFVLGIALAWITLSQSAASWATPTNSLLGLALVATLVSISWLLVWANKKTRTAFTLFGDGDMIALIALSLYFGLDMLTIIFGACLIFCIICIKARAFESVLRRWGQYPVRQHSDVPCMPFMPAVYVGTLLTVFSNKYFSISPMIESVYQKIVG